MCHVERRRERSPGQLLKPLTQEPQSSRKLCDQIVRQNGRHGQTRVYSGARPRLRSSCTLPTPDRAHKCWQMRTAIARLAVQKLIHPLPLQYCLFHVHESSPTICCVCASVSFFPTNTFSRRMLRAPIIALRSNDK